MCNKLWYIAGGSGSGWIGINISRLSFSTETLTTVSSTLGSTRHRCTGINSKIKGYVMAYDNKIDALTFDTETNIQTADPLSLGQDHSGCQSGGIL